MRDVEAMSESERLFLKFQTSETVPGHDPERVLNALEVALRNTFEEVSREGARLSVRGLGPSPRRVNLQDVTELSVEAMQGGSVIKADMSFQASALLGDMPQNELVRSKLEGVFQQMKAQLDLETIRTPVVAANGAGSLGDPSGSEAATTAVGKGVEAQPVVMVVPPAEDVTDEDGSNGVIETVPEAVEVVRSAKTPDWGAAPALEVVKPDVTKHPLRRVEMTKPDVANEDVTKTAAVETQVANFSRAGSSDWVVDSSVEAAGMEEESGWSFGERLGLAFAVLILVVLSAAGAYLFWGRYQTTAERNAVAISQRKAADASRMAAASAGAGHMGSDLTDPKAWVEKWGDAMRSSDAATQASFYAIPVSRYLLKWNVSREELVKEKQAAINARKGLWTVRLEKIVVEKETASDATVRLVKHSMVQVLPYKISERWVKTRLQLKRIDGRWKIISERDILPD